MSKGSHTFITLIKLIMTFSLNLGTSNKSFETTKYSLENLFKRNKNIKKKKKNRNFLEKHYLVTLIEINVNISCAVNFMSVNCNNKKVT